MLKFNVTLGQKLVLGPYPQRSVRTPPCSSSPRCSLALVTNSSHSSLRVFKHLRTLSFSVSHLSRVLPTGCALFRKKPGVHRQVLSLSLPFPGTPFSRMATLSACLPLSSRWPLPITPFTTSTSPRENLQGIAIASPLSPFATSLTQKQGGRGYWSYQSAERATRLVIGPQTLLCVLCVSAVSRLLFPFVPLPSPPCPTTDFRLKWGYPFPVITGENQ